jgi:hypothetical protein
MSPAFFDRPFAKRSLAQGNVSGEDNEHASCGCRLFEVRASQLLHRNIRGRRTCIPKRRGAQNQDFNFPKSRLVHLQGNAGHAIAAYLATTR